MKLTINFKYFKAGKINPKALKIYLYIIKNAPLKDEIFRDKLYERVKRSLYLTQSELEEFKNNLIKED